MQVVGFTPTGKNFTIAYVFLEHERTENFVWALQQVRYLFTPPAEPIVIITDADRALIKAVPQVFPDSAHHLCRRHIEMNVRKRGLDYTRSDKFADAFMRSFNEAISAPNRDEWEVRWRVMRERYSKYPVLLKYLSDTWIEPYSHMVLSMYTDQVLHFGTHTTNRCLTFNSFSLCGMNMLIIFSSTSN